MVIFNIDKHQQVYSNFLDYYRYDTAHNGEGFDFDDPEEYALFYYWLESRLAIHNAINPDPPEFDKDDTYFLHFDTEEDVVAFLLKFSV